MSETEAYRKSYPDVTVIEQTDEIVIDGGGIIDAIRVVAHFNPPLEELVLKFEANLTDLLNAKTAVADAVGLGATYFEALGNVAPRAADAVHDFVYQVSNALNSVITKNTAREQVIRELLSL